MKNKILSWAILLALCVGFSSCSKDDDEDIDSGYLIGKWQLTEVKINGVIDDPNSSDPFYDPCDYDGWVEYEEDGTIINYDDCSNDTSNGTWELKGNSLKIIEEPLSASITFKVVELTQTKLILEFDFIYTQLLTYKRL